MIEAFEKRIGEHNFTITQLPARRALRLQAKLLKLIGPCAGVVIEEAFKELKDSKGNVSAITDKSLPRALNVLAGNLDEKQFEALVLDLIPGIRVDGKELTEQLLDVLFAGKLNQLFLLLKEVLEVNFGDFFQEGSILRGLLASKES